jgi:polyisoprenoid-binding protein YceI
MDRRFGLLGLLLQMPYPLVAAPEWRVDPARSSLSVVFDQDGKPDTAAFGSFQAAVTFDPADLAGSHAEIVVDLASFRSGDGQRD